MLDEDEHIRGLWTRMAEGWAHADATRFASVFSDDCDFTTVRGEKPPGRDGIAAGHARLFEGAYRDTVLEAHVDSIWHAAPGLAVVNASSRILIGSKVLASTHAMAVVSCNQRRTWRIVAFHNMLPAATADADTTTSLNQEQSMSKLRHLAIVVRDPEKVADFYARVFGMKLFHRDPDGSCFVSDGYFSLALVKHQLDGETPLGMNHFGFHVDNAAAISATLQAEGLDKPAERFTNRPFAEYRAMDPEGNWFDLSEHGFGGPSQAPGDA
ncbi:SgcJ/EcaC family oxidoreductase [Streptomyces avermitilis]|uniref:SgcJ/EcaC family oxidoreductase n=1 Tax=Streptomyces avermitilis TaxID=33903 RepID=UPI00339DC558